MKWLLISLTSILALTNCAGSVAWYADHPEREKIIINKRTWNVIPRSPSQYDVISFEVFAVENPLGMKHDQIKAVETITGCKVIEAEHIPETTILQTMVKCK